MTQQADGADQREDASRNGSPDPCKGKGLGWRKTFEDLGKEENGASQQKGKKEARPEKTECQKPPQQVFLAHLDPV
jgi:hypothetical protein